MLNLNGIAVKYLLFMKQVTKILRNAGLVMLIILASFGVGIAGGVPIAYNRRREVFIELRTEIKETDEKKTNSILFEDLL